MLFILIISDMAIERNEWKEVNYSSTDVYDVDDDDDVDDDSNTNTNINTNAPCKRPKLPQIEKAAKVHMCKQMHGKEIPK